MTERKESSPESSTSSDTRNSGAPLKCPLLLQVPLRHHSSSTSTSQSSPRPSGRGSSSTSSLSIGQTSYRDLTDIQDEFKIVKTLYNGSFSKILLAKHEDDDGKSASTSNYLVLKAIPSGGLFTYDFKRELRYNYFLSPHPNIVTSFNISFNWASCFNVYVQEYAPFGDLSRHVTRMCCQSASASAPLCLPECQVKLMAHGIASALEFMHSFKLVHQDLRAENVLVFKSNLSVVKLGDFGATRKEGTLITKGSLVSSSGSNLLPPEISYLLPQERYECQRSSDVWQMGILLCVCLTGSSPWESADFTDPVFRQYTHWLKRKSLKVPEPFRKFTPRLVRLLKRLLEPKCHRRSEIREVFKYLGDDWIKPNCRNVAPTTVTLKQNKGSLKVNRQRKNKARIATDPGNTKSIGNENSNDASGMHKVRDVDISTDEKDNIVKQWIGHWVASTSAARPEMENAHNPD